MAIQCRNINIRAATEGVCTWDSLGAYSGMRTRHGTTLIEQLVLLVVVGIGIGISMTGGARLLNTATVHGAARETAEMFAMARDRAMATGRRTAVTLDARSHRMIVHAFRDTLALLDLSPRGVRLETTRDSMAYQPSGLGYGAANLRVIVKRGASQDTITVSRLGRVKR